MTTAVQPKFPAPCKRDHFLATEMIEGFEFDLYLCAKSFPEERFIQVMVAWQEKSPYDEAKVYDKHLCSLSFQPRNLPSAMKRPVLYWSQTKQQHPSAGEPTRKAMNRAYDLAESLNFLEPNEPKSKNKKEEKNASRKKS